MAPALFAGLAAFYLTQGTADFTAVDGALRALEPFRDGARFHDNNHLLYPLWISGWVRLLGALGAGVDEPLAIIGAAQALNALLGAAGVAIAYLLLVRLADYRAALACSLALGCSRAVLVHATSSAEPLAGFFFAIAGLHLVAGAPGASRPPVRLVAAGLAFAAALASYQAMGTVAAVAALLAGRGGRSGPEWVDSAAVIVGRLAWIAAGGLAGVVAIYGGAYAAEGVPLADMPARFLAIGGAPEVYSGFSVARAANLPFGLVEQTVNALPEGYAGIRSLASAGGSALPSAAAALALWGGIASLVAAAWLAHTRGALALRAASMAVAAAMMFPLVYWDPLYDKLWLLPLSTLLGAVAISLRPGALPGTARRLLAALVATLLVWEAAANLPAAVASHRQPTPYLDEAASVARIVGPGDRVVLDFDPVSSLWFAFFRERQPVLLLPASTPRDAETWLRDADIAGGGRIVFVGVLDQDRATWDAFLGRRVGIAFDRFEAYRAASRAAATIALPAGRLTVRVYEPR